MLALGKLLELTLAGREPAQKIQLTVDGVQMRWLSEGALEVRPPEALDNGSDLLLSSGIHGNETAPIELLDRLLHGIARGEIKPRTRILFLFGNPEAMRRGERYLELDINRLFTMVFAFGAMLAGFAGVLAAPIFSVEPGMGDNVLILAFVVIVIGGIGSIRGAFLAALLVGLIDTLGKSLMPDLMRLFLDASAARQAGAALASMLVYVAMAAILAFRPAGLFPVRAG